MRSVRRLRPAFTLVELLVVLAIIGVLAALVAAAVSKVIPAQQQRNTERTIIKVNGELQAHWRAVIDDTRNEFKPTSTLGQQLVAWTGGDQERAKVLWTKLRLVQQFPMSYQEVLYPPLGMQDPTYVKRLAAAGLTTASVPATQANVPSKEEIATCLHMVLTAKGHRGKTTPEDMFNSDEKGTYVPPQGNGQPLPMIVDNWRQAICFIRWPSGDPTFQGTRPTGGAANTFADPLDPMGRLMDPTWNNATNAANITSTENAIKHPLHIVAGNKWQPMNWYLLPVVVSAGQDGVLGLDYYMTPGTGADDNIYSYLLK